MPWDNCSIFGIVTSSPFTLAYLFINGLCHLLPTDKWFWAGQTSAKLSLIECFSGAKMQPLKYIWVISAMEHFIVVRWDRGQPACLSLRIVSTVKAWNAFYQCIDWKNCCIDRLESRTPCIHISVECVCFLVFL